MTITRLLVANRGEIARRVFRTCRELGIETVAVHSDADAAAAFVADADAAVRLPGNTPAETYLRGDLVVEAALRAGADAIHPGYGFLSENAGFARQVLDAGLTWVGPTPDSMTKMGTKVEAKQLMAAAGVPVLEELPVDAVGEADLPILVKASSGGGGRGMRVVRELAELSATVELASNEAASAFGDPTVFCEPYVAQGRHIEVQVVGDSHGTVLVLGERDCSVQRRHQKVIEETPAPGLSGELRTALHEAARAAAEAIDYVGAGTVEFLVDVDRAREGSPGAGPPGVDGGAGGSPGGAPPGVFFLEMNTRLQVEHPVTECVTGLDLVALQIDVAEGRSLAGLTVPEPRGHSVEVRLYAEDPARDYQPQSGRLTRFEVPHVVAEFANPATYGIRLDSGVRTGDEIGTFYDAMVAKVVVWAADREQALRRLAASLARAELHGLRTNRDLLVNLLRDPVVVAGEMHTSYLDTVDLAPLVAPASAATPGGADATRLSGFAAALSLAEDARRSSPVQRRIPAGWRNVVSAPQRTVFAVENGSSPDAAEELEVRWYGGRSFASADLDDVVVAAVDPATPDGADATGGPATVVLEVAGVARRFVVHRRGDRLDVESSLGHVALRKLPRFVDPADQVASGSLLAPMPGTVVSVNAAAGDRVRSGQPVLVLEAMKMQHSVNAPHDGTVTQLDVTAGQQVSTGDVLAVVDETDEGDDG